jgi:tight adherence protein B
MTPMSQQLVWLSSLSLLLAVVLGVYWLWPYWDEFTNKRIGKLAQDLIDLGFEDTKIMRYHRLWGVALIGGFLFFWLVLEMPALGVVLVFLMFLSPGFMVRRRLQERKSVLRDQMSMACTALANTTRAGLALAQGFESISKEIPEPLAAEFRRMVGEFHRGRPFPDVIRDTQARLQLESFTLFASSVLVCLDRGGRITESLDRISKSLQETQRLKRKLEADTASGRKVVTILGAFPFLFLFGFYLLDPESTDLILRTIPGQMVLLVVGLLDFLSIIWAQRILKIDVMGY